MRKNLNNRSQEIFASIWSNLRDASLDRKHPWRYIQLSTVNHDQALARTVVVRKINEESRCIECHTDYRSSKIQQIKKNPKVLFLAFNSISKVQISCFAEATIHYQNHLTKSRWLDNHRNNQLTYANRYAPGSQLSNYAQLQDNTLSIEEFEPESAYQNFAVIESKVHLIDYLSLENLNHLRAQFRYVDNEWTSYWLAP